MLYVRKWRRREVQEGENIWVAKLISCRERVGPLWYGEGGCRQMSDGAGCLGCGCGDELHGGEHARA